MFVREPLPTQIELCMYVFVYVGIKYVCVYACRYICMCSECVYMYYVCMFVRVCMNVCMYVCMYYTCIYVYVYTFVCMCECIHMYICIPACIINTCITFKNTCICGVCVYIYTNYFLFGPPQDRNVKKYDSTKHGVTLQGNYGLLNYAV